MDATDVFIASEDVTLGVLPSGTVGLVADPFAGSRDETGVGKSTVAKQSLPQGLLAAFGESAAAGLTLLASNDCQSGLSSTPEFWRDFARRYFRSLCRQSSQVSRDWSSPEPPGEELLSEILQSAPPMIGLEYLSCDSLARLWKELGEHTHQQVIASQGDAKGKKTKGDLAAY